MRHLLTHTAGIPEQVPRSGIFRTDFGESVKLGRPVPSLAEYYRGGLRLDAEPGTMFRYGDHGPATLGQIVEDVSGTSLNRYLREHVFEPLGMADTTLVRSEVVQSRLATGYKLSSTGPKPVTDREVVTAGAGGIYSTPKDMARYLAALLGGGANEHGTVLKPATLASMFAAQYQPDPRIPGMGLAFWRRTAGGHPVVEHQGIIPGFDSQILVAPDDGVGLMAFTNGASRAVQWMPVEMSRLLHDLLGVPDDVIRTDVPQQPEIWGDICGWYYLPGPLTDVRLEDHSGRWRRGLRPPRPARPPVPDPDTGSIQGLPAAPGRRHGPLRVPDGPLRVRTGPLHGRLQPRTRNGNNGGPLRCDAAVGAKAGAENKPEAVGRRGTRPLDHGDPRPQTPSHGRTRAVFKAAAMG